MRKITKETYNAFINKKRFIKGNTKVLIGSNGESYLYLFDNLIAKTKNGETYISDGGFRHTKTTKERLSPFVKIRLCKGEFIINERVVWNGDWLNITK